MSINCCTWRRILITEKRDILGRATFSPNMHWWANQAPSWLLRILTFYIIWIYQFICQRLSFPLYDTHSTWLSLTNEPKFNDYRYQINSLSFVNLLLLIIKFAISCEGKPCRVRMISYQIAFLNACVTYFVWNFQKYPYIERCVVYWELKIDESLDLGACKHFSTTPPPPTPSHHAYSCWWAGLSLLLETTVCCLFGAQQG